VPSDHSRGGGWQAVEASRIVLDASAVPLSTMSWTGGPCATPNSDLVTADRPAVGPSGCVPARAESNDGFVVCGVVPGPLMGSG
jgi:hypothetical protein